MDRRTFLRTTTAAAAASTATAGAVHGAPSRSVAADGTFAAPPAIPQRHELQIQVPSAPHLVDAASEVLREISQASSGRFVFQLNESATPAASTISDGTCHGAIGHIAQVCEMPALSTFSGMPDGASSSLEALLAWYAAAAGDMYLDECAAEFGLTAMITGHTGNNPGVWATRPLTDLQDFATATIETVGTGPGSMISTVIAEIRRNRSPQGESARASGGDLAAVYLDATASAVTAFSAIAPERRKVWYADGIHSSGHASMLFLARTTRETLSSGDRILIQAITRAAVHRDLARTQANQALLQNHLFASTGIMMAALPPDISDALHNSAKDVCADIIARAPPSVRRANQALTSFAAAFAQPPSATLTPSNNARDKPVS